MDGREGLTEVLTDERGLAGAAGAFGGENLGQRPPADELHAEPGPAVPLFRVMHDDDVRVLHARQSPRLVQHAVDQAGRAAAPTCRSLTATSRCSCTSRAR